MLVKFTFKNYRSFLEEQIFTLEARHDKEFEENVITISKDLVPGNEGILKCATIFGANASGKSNVLYALNYMKKAVLLSSSAVDIIRHNDTFAFKEGADKLDSHFEVEFIEKGTYYRYGFVIKEKRITKEWLFKRNERLTALFKRDNQELAITGLTRNEAKVLSPSATTLFISIAENLNLEITPQVRDVLSWFRDLTICLKPKRENLGIYLENPEYLKTALDIMKRAGIGIYDMHIIKDGSYIDAETVHPVFDQDGNITKTRRIRIFQETDLLSDGSIKLILEVAPVLRALDKGGVLLINDFGSTLHYHIINYIRTLFGGRENKMQAQLITTSQVSLLMDKDMRRDQIWFTSKDGFERSTLLPLSSYKNVRKSDAYSKKYLSGEYTGQYPIVI